MAMTNRPDLFIAGAPKCGSAALFAYLARHPRVFMPAIKEPNFFCTDLKINGSVQRRDGFRAVRADSGSMHERGSLDSLYVL